MGVEGPRGREGVLMGERKERGCSFGMEGEGENRGLSSCGGERCGRETGKGVS